MVNPMTTTRDSHPPFATTEEIVKLHGDPVWEAIWSVVKTWDINTPRYIGYCSGTGDHATEIFRAIRSASQAGGVPAGWMDMADAPRTRPIIVLTAGGRIIKAKWVIIGDDAVGWGTPDEDDPHPNCWHTGFCWASNEDEEPSDPPVGWIEIPSASPPPPATDGDALEKLRDAAERAVKIIKTNLYHQREKVEDAASILRDAIASVPTPVSATDAVEAEREKVAFFNVVVCGALQWFEDHRVALQKVGSGTIPQWVLDGWALKAAIRARGTDGGPS